LPEQTGSGRRCRYCEECKRLRRNAAERRHYAEDPEFRSAQLTRRRKRYAANVEQERDRAQTWYRANRDAKIAAVTKARAASVEVA